MEDNGMAKVSIVMGSDSDMPVMAKAVEVLERFGVDYEMRIISAHREPDVFFEYAKGAKDRGVQVIIAGAGKAAHLPGMCAALFEGPVVGIPMKTSDLGGVDSLYSIVQMPTGVPVATVAINGGANAGILAVKMLAMADSALAGKLHDFIVEQKESVEKKDGQLQADGYKVFL
jgi:5-(carboxyamino)imidazole ribonucleotide mutase